MNVRGLLTGVALIALLAGCADLPSRRLPHFGLTSQSGKTVGTEDLRGQVVVVSFIFTTCQEVCPLVTGQLVQVQAEASLPPATRFVSITLDPTTDTPDVLQRYAGQLGADTATWDFLTGQPDEIRRVVQALGLFAASDRGRLGHDSPVLLVDREGRIVRRYDDTSTLSARILDDIRRMHGTPNAGGRRGAS